MAFPVLRWCDPHKFRILTLGFFERLRVNNLSEANLSDQLGRADLLVVGSGFYGATVAERAAASGYKVVVLEKRPHIGGNSYSEVDSFSGVEVHRYGSHLFHTSNKKVWEYANRFTSFNDYRHVVGSTYQGKPYPMPINLATMSLFLAGR